MGRDISGEFGIWYDQDTLFICMKLSRKIKIIFESTRITTTREIFFSLHLLALDHSLKDNNILLICKWVYSWKKTVWWWLENKNLSQDAFALFLCQSLKESNRWQGYRHIHVTWGIVHNRPDVEIGPLPIERGRDKETVTYVHNEGLVNHRENEMMLSFPGGMGIR